MLQALQLRTPTSEAVALECRARGLLVNVPRPDVLRFMPALDVGEEEIDRMAVILEQALAAAPAP